ncbi:hypothetical protein [Stappia sp. MMSF_3263]|uniref:hypothetical protein n=1 Tax=Stappia sp. MMSF_3263 TaxID=3046693 RepID=UPI00273FEB84|nr:hypothetical protein [Stappia sp. MMSF_3263]
MSLVHPLALAALGGCAATAVAVHDFFEGETLVADLIRTRRLARRDIAELDARAAAAPERGPVVTLTTIPSRIGHIAMTIKSLLDQSLPPAEIRLNVPEHSRRENCGYEIPGWLTGLATVTIVRCQDFGPATKLFPTLTRVPEDTAIVVVDDDRIYPPDFLENLAAHATAEPDAAFGLSGWVVPDDFIDRPTTLRSNLFMLPPAPIRARRLRRPVPIDILQGFSGYLVRPRFFPEMEAMLAHRDAPEAAFFVDDVWISGFCAAPKYVAPARRAGFQMISRMSFYKASSLARVNRGEGTPETRNNTIVIRHLADRWTVGGHRPAGSRAPAG